MSEDFPTPETAAIAEPADSGTVLEMATAPHSTSRRRTTIAGSAALVTALALGGWSISSAIGPGAFASASPKVERLDAGSTAASTAAINRVESAVVDITATDGYSGQEDRGTGMVISSHGEILTNNHVVAGATSLSVRLVSTGATYRATVVGTDASQDVAVIKLSNASGLTTITAGDAEAVRQGIAVTAVGNALGQQGDPTVTSGAIVGTGQSITATDEGGSAGEQLTGLLQTNADIVSGDPGGPMVDSSGQVIGMDTAAASQSDGSGYEDSAVTSSSNGYAIPITTALKVAHEIISGSASSTVVIGTPGFLGVQVTAQPADTTQSGGFGDFGDTAGSATTTPGATIAGAISPGPAASLGLSEGDTITAIAGTSVTSATELTHALARTHGGDRVSITWTDTSGAGHQAIVTLSDGPAA